MKIFVTGICGRLGKAIASEAGEQGHTVVGLDLVPWPDGRILPENVEIHQGSFEDEAILRKLLPSCEAIINAGGPTGEQVEELSLPGFLHANVTCVARMLDLAVQFGVGHVALSSTIEVLFGRDWTTSGALVVDEDFPPRTDSAYSISRLLQEKLAQEFTRNHPIFIACLRYVSFGYHSNEELGIQLLARHLSSRDVARAAIRAASVDGLQGDVIHIGPKNSLTNQDILRAMKKPEEVLEKYYPGALEVLVANGQKCKPLFFWPVTRIRKAKVLLDWAPEYTFEDWLVDHGWKGTPRTG